MAGEWIPIDCNLATKPEVLEVAAATHEPIEVCSIVVICRGLPIINTKLYLTF